MKLNKWMFGVLATALFAACSDNDLPDGGPAVDPGEGQGYIGINIQLPTVNSTRANDVFDDGVSSEHVVDDAVLLLFQGADEATARFTGAFTLQEANPTIVDGGQISRQSVRIANVTNVNFENNLFALVLVNGIANGLYDLANPEAAWMKNADNTGKTIQQFQETILKLGEVKLYDQITKGRNYASNIFMANSPLSKNHPGGTKSPGGISESLPVLVKIDPTTYETQKEALEKPAGTIHVERIVGKITCSNFNKETDLEVELNGYKYKLEVDTIWWDMAQDMADTYVVRNTRRTDSNKNYLWRWDYATSKNILNDSYRYRMIGEDKVFSETVTDGAENETTINYYRPYFCQVPGYATSGVAPIIETKNFTKVSMEFNEENPPVKWTKASGTIAKGPGAFYPLENTFPVEAMVYANTTRIGFWVTFKFTSEDTNAPAINPKDMNFYIHGMDKTTLFLDDEKGHDPLTNLAIAALSNEEKYPELWEAVKEALNKEDEGSINNVNIGDLIEFTKKDTKDGSIEFTAINFKNKNDFPENIKELFKNTPNYEFSALVSEMNNLGQYYKYDKGRVFYEVRIKHFGDDNTPWDNDEDKLAQATTIEESYGKTNEDNKRDKDFLGRYGIVRNNWYDLDIKKITSLGDPKDPELWKHNWGKTPDDNKDQYIAVEMRVLSWAKRSQTVIF